jgi:tripartite-type tricarboxylate transporter receptor subunit TctC
MKINRRDVMLSAAASLMLPSMAHAQSYPTKPIKFILAFSAGTGVDVAARIFAQYLGEELKTTVVVENRTGANGTIGTVMAAREPPDGYSLTFVSPPFTNAQLMVPDKTYDPVKDFKPIARLAMNPVMIVAGKEQPFKNFKELVAFAKANPGRVQYATSGKGASSHIYTEQIAMRYGLKMIDIPYKNFSAAITDVIAGRVHFFLSSYSALLPQAQAGAVNALVVGTQERSPVLPNVSTLAEEYGEKDTYVRTWYGLMAPAGTPDSIVNFLYEKLRAVVANPEFKKKLEATGSVATLMPPKEFGEFIVKDRDESTEIIKKLGLLQQPS